MTNRHFLHGLIALLGIAAALIWIGRYTDLDLYFADMMFDFSINEFPWREHWFTGYFMHHVMKVLMMGIGMAPAAALIADILMKRTLFDDVARRKVLVVVAAFILIPAAISLLKTLSIHHCPWDLERYGGFAPYLRIFDRLPPGASPGHCFPAGHASSALWIASIAVFWLPGKPGRALTIFCLGLIPGIALGWAQQMRGAHFLTHTLWSAWIAALITLCLTWVLCGHRRHNQLRPAAVG